ncbi:uncharacterized protein [Chironomus tepperi]|uniref:uncharacterized protein n=1 Tax=Chironomus tepperi TaxID=113505 RepID=UPI00391F6D18
MLSILARRCATNVKTTLITVQKRNFLLGKRVSEKKFKLRDKIDPEWSLIYKAPMEYYLAACNHITTLSAILFTGYIIVKFKNRHEKVSTEMKPFEMLSGKILMADSDYVYFAIGFVVINIVLRITAYRFPLRIYKKGTEFTAVFEGQVPFSKDKYVFAKGAIKEEPIRGVLPWRDCRYKIDDKRKVILLYESFKTPSELFEMLKKKSTPRVYQEKEMFR